MIMKTTVKLKDIASYSKGSQINGNNLIEDGAYEYLNGGIDPSGKWNEYNVDGNTITISEGGNSCGYVNYMINPFWCGAHCYYLYNLKCSSKYLYYALKGNQSSIMKLRSGACMPNIKKKDLGEFILSIDLDKKTQDKTIEIFNDLSSIITHRRTQLEKLDLLVKARFVEMCNANPSCNLLSEFISKYNAERCGERDLPVLSITKNAGIVLQSEKFSKRIASIDSSTYKIVPRGKLVQGIHIDERNFDIQDVVDLGIVSPAYKIWSVNDEKCIPKVLAFALRTDKTMEYIKSKFTGSVKRRESISYENFMNTPIDLPSYDVQTQFADFVKKVDKSKATVQKALDEAQLLFDSLMQEYFG